MVYFEYDRDPAGDVKSVRRESGDVVYYKYDDLRRLTAETWRDNGRAPVYAFAWDYDHAGNRTVQSKDLGGSAAHTYFTCVAANHLPVLSGSNGVQEWLATGLQEFNSYGLVDS